MLESIIIMLLHPVTQHRLQYLPAHPGERFFSFFPKAESKISRVCYTGEMVLSSLTVAFSSVILDINMEDPSLPWHPLGDAIQSKAPSSCAKAEMMPSKAPLSYR